MEAAMNAAKPGDTVKAVHLDSGATTYTVAFRYNDGSSADLSYTVLAGMPISLPTVPSRSGYIFLGWYLGSQRIGNAGVSYTVNDAATFDAQWMLAPTTPEVPVTPDRDDDEDSEPVKGSLVSASGAVHGTVRVNPGRAEKGDTVTVTAIPDDGYVLESLTVTERNGSSVSVKSVGGDRYTFTMPSGAVTVKAVFVQEGTAVVTPGEMSFTDVPSGFWAYSQIQWAYENGYMNGTGATTFNPNGTVSRQQVWMILARMAGANPADMAAAKTWAVNNGISDGTNPGGSVSRQQLVSLLYRFAAQYGYDTTARADLSGYPDVASLASYAADPMAWAVANSIIGGTTQGTLDPAGTANRAQFAVILWRFFQTAAV